MRSRRKRRKRTQPKGWAGQPILQKIQIFDLNKKLTQKVSKILKSKPINNPLEALKDSKLDAVFIASSTSTHIKLIVDSVKYKKVIFCEKPLDLNINKINDCKRKIKKLRPKIQLGFNRRYDPGHNSLKKHLLSGVSITVFK